MAEGLPFLLNLQLRAISGTSIEQPLARLEPLIAE
jgi:hypothetical protein